MLILPNQSIQLSPLAHGRVHHAGAISVCKMCIGVQLLQDWYLPTRVPGPTPGF